MNCKSIAVITESDRLTYDELIRYSDELVEGIPSRSLVFMKVKNNLESIAFYIGCVRNRIVPLMINADMSDSIWRTLVDIYRPRYAWLAESICAETAKEPTGQGRRPDYRLIEINEVSPDLHNDLALLLSTSGSTGSPKLVRLSYQNLDSNARAIADYLALTPDDRAITMLPFGYTYGISVLNSHLLAGASVILTEKSLMEKDFWRLFKEHGATSLVGVPYTYQMLERLRFERMELPSLRYMTQAGGRLGESLHERFADICKEKDIDFFVMYGQTEATARMSYLPPEKAQEKIGSIGIAIPGGAFSLIDDEGNEIDSPDKAGELVYCGPNVSMGYAYCADDLAKGDERQGVLRTGDLAKRDAEGFYYITGRKSRFLKVYGNRIGLDELESLLSRAGYIVAIVGTDDHVVIFLEDGDESEAIRAASSATGINAAAFDVRRLSPLPRTSAGKISYAELKKMQ